MSQVAELQELTASQGSEIARLSSQVQHLTLEVRQTEGGTSSGAAERGAKQIPNTGRHGKC